MTRNILDEHYNHNLNVIKISKHETFKHAMAKCKLCILLKQEGIKFVTEAIFEGNNGRADIFLPDRLEVYEVLESETKAKFNKKKETYPKCLNIFGIKAQDILKEDFVL